MTRSQDKYKKKADKAEFKRIKKSGKDETFRESDKSWRGRTERDTDHTRGKDPAEAKPAKKKSRCPVSSRCGGCTMIDIDYDTQIRQKQEKVDNCIGD
ncbi:MAG: hypothetical protein II628_16195, partial [Lachnospiraceae bacterium]|nr:hypothetical protein [Lachnospiraceae bacterium]